MQLERTNNQLAQTPALPASSRKLLECLVRLDGPAKAEAKMDLITIVSDLVPEGRPDFRNVVKYPKIADLVQAEGKRKLFAILAILVRDFCASINVVRNMNEDQIIETAAMLLDECGNFRLEDYVMMFAMAKRGGLVKIYDRLDISVVTQLLDAYWKQRADFGKQILDEETEQLDQLGPTVKLLDNFSVQEAREIREADTIAGRLSDMKAKLNENRPNLTDQQALGQLLKNENYINPYPAQEPAPPAPKANALKLNLPAHGQTEE